MLWNRVRKLKSENAQVVDVDGSYLYKKQQTVGVMPDDNFIPEPPLTGWIELKPECDAIKKVPVVTHGMCNNTKNFYCMVFI